MSRITDIAKTMKTWWSEDDDAFVHRALDEIIRIDQEQTPTIEPKRERCEYCKDGDFMGQRIMLGNDGKWHKILFCPNCGADMRGADDE